jgi:hypothetical protein
MNTVTPGVKEPTRCPHCGETLSCEIVSQLTDKSRLKLKLTPHEGQFASAATLAGVIGSMDKMLKELGREHGVKQSVSIERIDTDQSGEMTISILAAVAEQHPPINRREGRK